MGTLIAIEGVDGSGKETQTRRLYEAMKSAGINVIRRGFPNYDSESSSLVKMYLMGKFGDDPKKISPYIASSFFAADRYASYMTDWKEHYENGGVVIVDRYTTANMIHQAGKISDIAEREKFLNWLYECEFRMYGIPEPDMVFFLDVPPEIQKKIVKGRRNKITGGNEQDIHEKSPEHIIESYKAARYVADKYGWFTVHCAEGDELRSIDSIGDEIFGKVLKNLNFR